MGELFRALIITTKKAYDKELIHGMRVEQNGLTSPDYIFFLSDELRYITKNIDLGED